MTRVFAIPLRFSVAGSASSSLSTKALLSIKRIESVVLIFPPNANDQLKYRLWSDVSAGAGSTYTPAGKEINYDEITPAEYVGESIAYEVPIQLDIKDSPLYLKLSAQNDTTTALIASCIWIVVKE